MCNTTGDNEYLKTSFKDFINNYFLKKDNKDNDKLPAYCREERQYALFLYNYLLKFVEDEKIDKRDDVIKACGLSKADKIISVYYEVAFMRDFLHKEKDNADSNFNDELFKYIKSKIHDDRNLKWLIDSDNVKNLFKDKNNVVLAEYKNESKKENPFNIYSNYNKYNARSNVNYGSNVKDTVNDNGEQEDTLPYYIRILMRAMMNSKADLGVLYLTNDVKDVTNNAKLHLKFIECKYESDESDIRLLPLKKDNSINVPFVLRQTTIQYFIAEFICNKLNNEMIEADYPTMVIFGNDYNTIDANKGLPDYYYKLSNKENENAIKTNTINISDLVPVCLLKPDIFSNND